MMKQDQDWSENFFEKHKVTLISGLLGVFILIGAVSGYRDWKESKREEAGRSVFEFRSEKLQAFKDKKIDAHRLLQDYLALQKDLGHHESTYALALDIGGLFIEQKNAQEAMNVYKDLYQHFSGKGFASYFLALHLANAYEEASEYGQAISVLEDLKNSSQKYLPGKVLLDLGRLNYLLGNKVEGKKYFKEVVDKYPNDSLAQLAAIYLEQ